MRTLPNQNRAPRISAPYYPPGASREWRRARREERRRDAAAWPPQQWWHARPTNPVRRLELRVVYDGCGASRYLLVGHEFGPHVLYVGSTYEHAYEDYMCEHVEPLTEQELADYAEPENEDNGGYHSEVRWCDDGQPRVEPEYLWIKEFRSKAELYTCLRERR